ncbi:hypothetical protein [Rheinheimera sp. WS51]|uniref:hypothetical protein n=1 Tax=Rheinheimera sp. WS51 TaxID=3425886 RepID=UPI003D9138DD
MLSILVASAGGTTLPDWPTTKAHDDYLFWPGLAILILVIVVGCIVVFKKRG